ncbi:threonine synthase-like 1 [Anneissia japonica]|uniref:threonine synthase-like 1 n=1 Tax=Anneissia japonica TaxID=1529436 RepID=UPI0014256D47|nr:threonine synthase-like 1 [Anneissia japonica]
MMWFSRLTRHQQFNIFPGSQWLARVKFLVTSCSYQNEGNIILMGSPGSGKTTHGRKLSQRLKMPVLDIDDDHLEPFWQMKVSQKLSEVGGERFLEAEGEALLQFKASNTIVSLTGSNPLHPEAMRIDGDFDFCQSAIKKIFSDETLNQELLSNYNLKLSAANSINWGRLLPQIVYHASGYLNMVHQGVIAMGDDLDVCIPTGNFGNILGAIYAKQMGIPFRRFICASNKNNVLTEFFRSGVYDLRQKLLRVTTSPAIDILKSSNLERYLYMVTDNDSSEVRRCFDQLSKGNFFQVSQDVLERMQRDILADWCSEETCSKTINDVFQKTGYLLDTHTAVAKAVADRFPSESVPMMICSTAHYGKFASDVLSALGRSFTSDDPVMLFQELKKLKPHPIMHQELEESIRRPKVHTKVLPANLNEIVSELKRFIERGYEHDISKRLN